MTVCTHVIIQLLVGTSVFFLPLDPLYWRCRHRYSMCLSMRATHLVGGPAFSWRSCHQARRAGPHTSFSARKNFRANNDRKAKMPGWQIQTAPGVFRQRSKGFLPFSSPSIPSAVCLIYERRIHWSLWSLLVKITAVRTSLCLLYNYTEWPKK